MRADLVLAPRLGRHPGEREPRGDRQRLKPGDRALPVGADGRLHEHRARRVDPEGLVDRHRPAEETGQDRKVGLPHPPVLHRGLEAARHARILCEHDHPARLPVQPEDQVDRRKARACPRGAPTRLDQGPCFEGWQTTSPGLLTTRSRSSSWITQDSSSAGIDDPRGALGEPPGPGRRPRPAHPVALHGFTRFNR
jgi:hypothetical protein